MNAGDESTREPRHALLAELFERAVAASASEREALLRDLEPALRTRLSALLAADASKDDPLLRAITSSARDLVPGTATGTRLGPWCVLRELGAGGMGQVLLAERADGRFTQQVAIKLIRGFPTEDGRHRLRQERQILAQLDHPNIAHLIDGGETEDGQPYVAMEYVDGLPLMEYIARHAPELHQRLELFDKVAAAVQHAHQRLVIHRDIKPGNVLVRADGEPKLLDFGVAKLVDLSVDGDLRQTSTRIWTPGYASPEQRAGRTVTTVSDVFALGILLREMSSGSRAPEEPFQPLAGFVPLALAADLRGILSMATADEASQRYASVEALREDLRRWREGRPVRAAADTPFYRLQKYAARHRMGLALATLALAGIAAFVWRLDHERERALAAEARATAARQAAERDAATAHAAFDFLASTLNAASPAQAMSAQISVRDLLDHARTELGRRDGIDLRLRQSIQRLLGHLYASLGEPAIAVELFSQGLAGVEPEGKSQALALAANLDGLSSTLGALERGAESLAAARASEALRQRFAPDDAAQEMHSHDQLAYAHYRNNDFEQAQQHWQRVLDLAATLSDPPLDILTNTLQAWSSVLSLQGDHARALQLAETALAYADGDLPPESPERVVMLRAQGSAMTYLGRADEGEAVLRHAIALQERSVGPRGIRMATLYNDLGIALNELGRYREAVEAVKRGQQLVSVASQTFGDDAVALNNLASTYENAGDYPAALRLFERALESMKQGYPDPDNLFVRQMERNYARCLGLAGQHARAAERLAHLRQRALELDGVDAPEYAFVTWQAVVLARRMRDLAHGEPLLAEALALFSALVPQSHPVFAHAHRVRADFAALRGDPETAEREQRTALDMLEAAGVQPVDMAIARAELAAILHARGAPGKARALLDQALPVLRETLLPEEIHRTAAESLARKL